MSLMGLDVGTTGCKAVAFDCDGKILASAYREYPLLSPQTGWFELDSKRVWEDIAACIREVAAKTTADPIKTLCVSCQGEAVTPVDADGNILDNAMVSFDARTAPHVSWWEKNVGREKIFQITGQPLASLFTALKLMWIRDHKPEVFKKTKYFLCYEEFVYHMCGLEPVTDYSLAGRTMLFDVPNMKWSQELMGHLDVSEDQFAKAVPSGTAIGTIGDAAAERLGLPKGGGGHWRARSTLPDSRLRRHRTASGGLWHRDGGVHRSGVPGAGAQRHHVEQQHLLLPPLLSGSIYRIGL